MKDEIKENIIQKSIECLSNAKLNDTTYEVARDIVLDHIINLQEDIKRLRQQNFNIIEYRDSLINENREQREDLFDYKSRINKAIEYIEKEYEDNIIIADHTDQPITPQDLYQDLLNILKGEDNDK